MKDTLILKDGTAIEIESGASLSALGIVFADMASMAAVFDILTDDNLTDVTIKNSSDVVIANYSNLTLVSETSSTQEDGTILTHFNLREKTTLEVKVDETSATTELNSANIDYVAMEVGVEL